MINLCHGTREILHKFAQNLIKPLVVKTFSGAERDGRRHVCSVVFFLLCFEGVD